MAEFLYGRNAVRECLRARRRHIHELLLADSGKPAAIVDEIITLAGQLGIRISRTSRKDLDSVATGHQGVALRTGRYPTVTLNEILQHAQKLHEPPFVLVLDHLVDPHNLGAILRSAEVVGVHGVVIPKQRAVSVTSTVVNVSAGAAEHIWLAEVPNIANALKELKQQGVWVAGLEYTPQATLYHKTNLGGAIALVIGSEGQGMSRLVAETCDFMVKLPMRGNIESLNASVACGLILYEVWRARDFQ